MAAASYYLVILNGPTPVVKERSEDTVRDQSKMAERMLSLVLNMLEEIYQDH